MKALFFIIKNNLYKNRVLNILNYYYKLVFNLNLVKK